ncbi:MAG: hypothetical protein CO118_06810 [Flavobacteriales bacterium CG_4_9_14_3_um_filter_32_8]|nr:MAG: hypothetical protein CO118_06810 [Flavobacteriales bacterium CG_4_9_14_3_um_filter_32_8]
MRNSLYIFFLISIFIFSCSKKEEVIPPDLGYDYAGLEVGRYIIYDVDSFYYDDFTDTIDTSYFKIKEVVDSKFTDLEGDEAFKIIRYRKENDTTAWELIDVWNSKITTTNFQKVEENVRFVKLIFPVKKNKTWNGNSMNNLASMEYKYTVIDNAEVIGGNTLNSVLTVLQYEFSPLIEENFFQEKYAKGVGMVYKKSVEIKNVYDSSSFVWERSLGYDVTMTLSSYGN